MKNGLGVGTTIFNDAEIYFDFNEPIFTNQVSTELIETTSIHPVAPRSKVTVYPNPTTHWANIVHVDRIDYYQLYDIKGALLDTKANSNRIDMHRYPKGIYFIKLIDQLGRLHSLKLIKL